MKGYKELVFVLKIFLYLEYCFFMVDKGLKINFYVWSFCCNGDRFGLLGRVIL